MDIVSLKGVINLKRIISGLFLFLAMMAISASGASAHTDDNAYRLAFKPVVVSGTTQMRARINNHSSTPQNRLVCIEAFNNAGGAKTHLGCLWVGLDGMGGENWAREFNAPTYLLTAGTYTVKYTYKAWDGSWHAIKSVDLITQNGSYTAP